MHRTGGSNSPRLFRLRNVSINYEFIAFVYYDTQNTIEIKEYEIAYNVAAEIEKHLKAGDMAD